jgi:DNA-binding beta-propeller fold protein YncE
MRQQFSRILIVLLIIFYGLFLSCSRGISTSTINEPIIFPPPPDSTRIQFLTRFSNSKDITGDISSFKKFVFGDIPAFEIAKPYGIAISKGKFYICDTGTGQIEIIDFGNSTFESFSPKGFGQLKLALNCFVDDRDYLYVADSERLQCVVFDQNRNYLQSIGDAENFKPTDIFVFNDKIWISNSKKNQINVFDKLSFNALYSFPESESGDEDFLYFPTNIFVNDDYVYVSDMGDFKIKIYTHEGKLVRTVGSYGRNIGQFARPKGIAVDRENNLFVVDAGFENTQIFDEKGNLLMYFGGPYNRQGDMWLPAKVIIDYDNTRYFEKYVIPGYRLEYLIFVSNQYGPDKINVYGFVEKIK